MTAEKEIVTDNFNMNVYLYNNYLDSNGNHFSDFTLYDKNNETDAWNRYKAFVEKIAISKQNLENNAKEVANSILKSIENGTEMDIQRRKTMLHKYQDFKSENDFNNPDKAPGYARQIVKSDCEEVSSYPQILGVVINQKSAHFQVSNEDKFFNALNIISKKTDKKSVKHYAELLTLEFQGKNIELENNDEYFLENYGIVPIFPVEYL